MKRVGMSTELVPELCGPDKRGGINKTNRIKGSKAPREAHLTGFEAKPWRMTTGGRLA